MSQRVAIVGTGWVGASVAVSTLHAGIADELLLYDTRREIAEGEAMDLSHGASFYPRAVVRYAPMAELAGADVIVLAAGRGGRPGESRLDLLRDNLAMVDAIGGMLVDYRGVVVVVSNPVDVLTWALTEASGLPAARVIGTGTALDTARLRHVLSRTLDVDPRSVHAQVIGEHGDSEVVLWSGASIGGVPLRAWPAWTIDREAALATEVRRAAYEIIQRKGATNHAIGLVTADVLRCVLRDERRVMTVSRVQTGSCGVAGVALSLPSIVGASGAATVLEPELAAGERAQLLQSAAVLAEAIEQTRR